MQINPSGSGNLPGCGCLCTKRAPRTPAMHSQLSPSAERSPQNNPNHPPAVATPQLCLPGLFSLHPQDGMVGEGDAVCSFTFQQQDDNLEGNSFSPATAQGSLGINRSCRVLPARSLRMLGWGSRTHAMTFCHLLMPRNKGRMSAIKEEGTKEGMGEKGGKEGRLTNKQKSPNPSERRRQNKLKLLWQLVCVGSNTRLRMHGIKTSVMFSS